MQRQHGVLEDARRAAVRADAIKELYPRLVERIEQATFDDKRFVLECLDAVVTVGRSGVALSLAVTEQELSSVSSSPGRAGW